ncbi:hypothetical protein BdWA1_002510 [Babesia duncani]|uniref:Uncharacterized protein n=1 Tax=Babesia duncani TaxID=323732 RepID=A0AAD9UNL3_9APIC|nr:hypothetical protein BdWA1_002510 [Babesia duncani]
MVKDQHVTFESKWPRLEQIEKHGSDSNVEPSPNVRIYTYSTGDSFGPDSELFCSRKLRELERESSKAVERRKRSDFMSLGMRQASTWSFERFVAAGDL